MRAAEFDTLFAQRLASVSRPAPLTLRLLLTGGAGLEEQVRDLTARESECCSFFTFTVIPEAEQLCLDVEVDAVHAAVLDARKERAMRLAIGPRR